MCYISPKLVVNNDVIINDKNDIIVETKPSAVEVSNLNVTQTETSDSISSLTNLSGSKRKYTSMKPDTSMSKSRKGEKNILTFVWSSYSIECTPKNETKESL